MVELIEPNIQVNKTWGINKKLEYLREKLLNKNTIWNYLQDIGGDIFLESSSFEYTPQLGYMILSFGEKYGEDNIEIGFDIIYDEALTEDEIAENISEGNIAIHVNYIN
ncbi:hypothetical protein [Clostridium massiliodielmoense]|uniref:hypothetical protein n=1 Tax=Clostridium massiliodielmoense TaxID=1776385 RepID=UPI000A270009|nr:hypothetical protein [Clostridium massiliodielmoense]